MSGDRSFTFGAFWRPNTWMSGPFNDELLRM